MAHRPVQSLLGGQRVDHRPTGGLALSRVIALMSAPLRLRLTLLLADEGVGEQPDALQRVGDHLVDAGLLHGHEVHDDLRAPIADSADEPEAALVGAKLPRDPSGNALRRQHQLGVLATVQVRVDPDGSSVDQLELVAHVLPLPSE